MYLDKYKEDIRKLCQEHKVRSLHVFGSVLTDKFTEKSDIYLLVDIDSNDPLDYADNYFALKFALQELFRRSIDLLESKALRNPYILENINRSKSLLYGA